MGPADDVEAPLKRNKRIRSGFTKLRKSITPGTVLILLAGRFRGRRVVFLKQMEKSSTLLVTGPYKVNGVPLRRVNMSYVIATSQKVDVSKVDSKKFNDAYFARSDAPADETLVAKGPTVSEERKKDQVAVDASIIAALGKN